VTKPEERARRDIDRLLTAAGWAVQDVAEANIHATRGVAIREFKLEAGHGSADYLLYVDGRAAERVGTFLTWVRQMPALITEWDELRRRQAQITAIYNIEASLAQSKPRALIQMATGSGKTLAADGNWRLS
jgi:type I site-specific restriction endonuclease